MSLALQVETNEQDLIVACLNNQRWAQKKIYEDHYASMLGVCMRYASDQEQAIDIVHEGFIKVFLNLEKYQSGTSLQAWIRRIMVNTSIDFYRRNIKKRTEDIEEAYHLSDINPDAVSNCTEKEIMACIQQLSPMYRAVFNLFVIDGFSHKEIAEELDITESTSRANLVKARLKLQELLLTSK
ncbi:MAG: sigma-70 family RNA polymerase sigma factor [Saprospiraceae bacterium]|jgi:RNA polymerase sigma-70 factor (ECF subfamily)|nr:sigma-70 family RNA polymerase sigma factor [Saprospiraceae bacterium]MBL0292827.1 sigma-70 family RNA polymerase sigma factor [Saprospiraceae bacterium]